MKLKKQISLLPIFLLLGTIVFAFSPSDEAYERGRDALDDQRYKDAYKAFLQSAEAGGDQSDAASYFLAYTMARMDRADEALDRLSRFQDEHPGSRWSDDARKLAQELSHGAVPPNAEEELKLIALHGLIATDPERAVPRLEKFLNEAQLPSMREEALFLLLQSGAPDAKSIALNLARSSDDPELRVAAIRSLATLGEMGADELAGLYDSTDSIEGKMAILEGYMINGDKSLMVDVARNETDVRLRRVAMEFLAMTGETDALKKLYRSEADPGLRAAVLESLAIAGDHAFLLEAVRSEKDPEIRAGAVRALGYSGGGDSDTLLSIYRTEKNPEVREAALEGLMMQGNIDTLIELARAEKDPEVKKMIVEMIASSGSAKAVDYLMELIDG